MPIICKSKHPYKGWSQQWGCMEWMVQFENDKTFHINAFSSAFSSYAFPSALDSAGASWFAVQSGLLAFGSFCSCRTFKFIILEIKFCFGWSQPYAGRTGSGYFPEIIILFLLCFWSDPFNWKSSEEPFFMSLCHQLCSGSSFFFGQSCLGVVPASHWHII